MTERDPVRPDTSSHAGSVAPAAGTPGASTETAPDYSTRPVAFRGPESLGGLLLLLAGIAAAISLLLRWVDGSDVTGWGLVRAGFETPDDLYDQGLWQPMAIILGGGLLFVLGLLMWLPARTHRTLGVLALLVSVVATAGVLVPLADDGWDLGTYDVGFWLGMAVPALGLLGALKAMLTGPRLATRPPQY
ncbi:hypothetical protein [Blastococcus deserti]|uniref:Membrane protein (TIGR02234 family) n=1 Tax=Blastococcus deserti TaxID=2259033 RepID=A0ABW4X658_9ACTN